MKLAGDTPTVLLPIETMAREADSKLVLATALAKAGCRVIVAHETPAQAIAGASRRIVFLGKDLFSETRDIHMADALIAKDSAIVYINDEGGIFQARSWVTEVLQKHQVDKLARRKIDRVCLWGARQVEVLAANAPVLRAHAVTTGTPRFDVCRPEFAWLTETKADLGHPAGYILACTRFSAVAHAEGPASPFRRKLNPRVWPDGFDPREAAHYWFSKWRRDAHDFADFVFMLKEMAVAFPDVPVVVRPHPSEDVDFYQTALASFPNVTVTRAGSALDWIRSARVVVHSNCTTGIEAVLAGRPVVNFQPGEPERGDFDIEVAREAGVAVHSVDDALAAVKQAMNGSVQPQSWSDLACSILNNLRLPSIPLLVQTTLSVLDERRISSSDVQVPIDMIPRELARKALGRTNRYDASKRPSIRSIDVERLVDACRRMGIGGGRVSRLTARYAVLEP